MGKPHKHELKERVEQSVAWETEVENHKNTFEEESDGVLEEVTTLFRNIPGFEQCEANDADEWLNNDANDPGFQMLTDEEITFTVLDSETLDMVESDKEIDVQEGSSHSGALKAFETGMSWLERQPESTPGQLLVLKRLRDMAPKKRSVNFIKKTTTNFFYYVLPYGHFTFLLI